MRKFITFTFLFFISIETFADIIKLKPNSKIVSQWDSSKVKTFKNMKEFNILKYKMKDFIIDGYYVEYKKEIYFVDSTYVIDNRLIDSFNKSIREIINFKKIYQDSISIIDNLLLSVDDSLSIIDNKILFNTNKIDSLNVKYKDFEFYYDLFFDDYCRYQNKNIVDSIEQVIQQKIDSVEFRIRMKYEYEKQKFYNNTFKEKKYLFNTIDNVCYYLGGPNSAGGCDFYFTANNNNKKSIKYVYITINGFKNRVDDYVYCDIRGNRQYIAKDTGPFEYEEEIGGTWENVIYNYSADKAIINNIKIVYMDNTSITLNRNDIEFLCNIDNYCSYLDFCRRNNIVLYSTPKEYVEKYTNERKKVLTEEIMRLDGEIINLNYYDKTNLNKKKKDLNIIKNELIKKYTQLDNALNPWKIY